MIFSGSSLGLRINNLILSLRKNTRGAKAKRQIIYSFGLKGTSILVQLLYVPLLIDILDKERYGVWLTLISIFSWFGFFDIGLGNGLRNKLTEALGLKQYDLAKKYIATTYALISFSFIPILLLFHFLNHFLNWNSILNTTLIPQDELFLLTSICFSFFILRFIFQLSGVIYLADQKPAVNNSILPISNLITLIIIYGLSRFSDNLSLVTLGAIVTIIPVLFFVLLMVTAFRNGYKHIRPSFKDIDFSLKKDLLTLGLRFFLMQITAVVIFSTANFAIAQLFDPSEVVIYNIAFQYFRLPIMFYGIILTPIWSAVTDAFVKDDYRWLKSTLRKLNFISVSFVCGIILMVFVSPYVYKFWVGNRVQVPIMLSAAMGLYASLNVIVSPYSSFINGLGKLKLTTTLSIFGVSTYLILLVTFCKLFDSSIGVVLSMSFMHLIGAILEPIQTHKLLNKTAKGIWNK